MAQVHPVGQPVNDSERKAIRFFEEHLDDYHHIYHNLEFSTENNNPYEYDMIVVHDKAIYCIEVKGWHGHIVGNANEWRIGDFVRKSPIMTNNNKKRVLQSYLAAFDPNLNENSVPVDSLIVLTEDSAEFKIYDSQDYRVHKLHDALKYMKQRQGSSIAPHYKKLNQFFENQFRPLSNMGRIREFEIIEEVSRDDSLGYIAYLCKHSIIDSKTYLLKVYNFEYLEEKSIREKRIAMVERDAKALHSIQVHLNIVDPEPPFYHTDGRFVLPLEWVDGLSLRSRLDSEGQLPFGDALKIAKQVADSLRHVHQFDVVHRNLTPQAIIIPKDEPLKLVNFDLAKASSIDALVTQFELQIDPEYAAPEILIDGSGKAKRQSDIYSLGVILFELFTGQKPYETLKEVRVANGLPLKPSDVNPSLPNIIDVMIMGMCKFKIADRYQDLSKVVSYLNTIKNTSAQATVQEGQILNNKYKIVRQLAKGGESIVYEGIQMNMNNRVVAIKIWTSSRLLDNAHNDEMDKLIALSDNPHVADVYDYETDNQLGVSYLVIEHAANGTLEDLMVEQGALPLTEAQRIFHQICVALDAMHSKNIIHLDIKPSNILFDSDKRVQVTDFGISKLKEQATTWSSTSGTPGYVDPDIMTGGSTGTPQSDIYSLGILLHQMLTGKSPEHHSVFEHGVDETLPAPIIDVIEVATDLEPDNRFETIALFEAAFNQAIKKLSQPIPIETHVPTANNSATQANDVSLWDRIKSVFMK